MPRVRFLAAFDFKPSPSVTLAFKAGEEKTVTSACAEAAIGKGKAERIASPRRRSING